jgi:hypothetical protein
MLTMYHVLDRLSIIFRQVDYSCLCLFERVPAGSLEKR